ncbi:MAG: prepilin-type N-terminal cleavage/methylation domain-containing protein [Deinococcota bacterium]
MSQRQIRKQQKGLTLVEVLVALAIIAITMVMFGYFSSSLQATGNSRRETAAANFARSYLDALRSQWQDLTMYRDGGRESGNARSNPPFLEVPDGFTFYTVDIERRNVTGVVVGTPTQFNSTAGEAAFNWQDENDTDFMRLVTLTLTDAQGETYTYSTQVVRPTTDQTP